MGLVHFLGLRTSVHNYRLLYCPGDDYSAIIVVMLEVNYNKGGTAVIVCFSNCK